MSEGVEVAIVVEVVKVVENKAVEVLNCIAVDEIVVAFDGLVVVLAVVNCNFVEVKGLVVEKKAVVELNAIVVVDEIVVVLTVVNFNFVEVEVLIVVEKKAGVVLNAIVVDGFVVVLTVVNCNFFEVLIVCEDAIVKDLDEGKI